MGQCGLSMPSRSRQMPSSFSFRPQACRQDMNSLAVSIVRLYSSRLRDLDFSSRLLISSSSSSSSSSRKDPPLSAPAWLFCSVSGDTRVGLGLCASSVSSWMITASTSKNSTCMSGSVRLVFIACTTRALLVASVCSLCVAMFFSAARLRRVMACFRFTAEWLRASTVAGASSSQALRISIARSYAAVLRRDDELRDLSSVDAEDVLHLSGEDVPDDDGEVHSSGHQGALVVARGDLVRVQDAVTLFRCPRRHVLALQQLDDGGLSGRNQDDAAVFSAAHQAALRGDVDAGRRALSWSMIPEDTGDNLSNDSWRLMVDDTCSSAQRKGEDNGCRDELSGTLHRDSRPAESPWISSLWKGSRRPKKNRVTGGQIRSWGGIKTCQHLKP
ncbi:hypothetical protein F7725_015233 [Dissostichus mawsoni]|uniref:Uncharacterized protein n=1 Tax=Dissostichus mawsoni TaxID=36200 RepID=A0A7J5YGW0_DISMA|nr:hypothetical protein F7725_015233 [Dissostichus mawsoni]